ncbi:TPA: DUF2231 domain-containing protein [Legionella pneumophila]|uniref:DUF2231 domain-containing protein n=1 Tax=Legionella bononiensis TaxID=2793102 RepID=A0ABS1WEP3_9GAMM|nr:MULTISPECIES: DUF2231 domain-containing protein [Legionellaceae]HAT8858012.1 DUF2231 domain-containing protein [Legionella pneumophila subsp. pneumophila]KTD12294.1 hypothetical protein Lhac_1165 [Legionella hackeliae]MBL7478636.1 DUF2231 domain-containing protein [Legionella bononiensis]MBL7527836.1 DUF2231 domain-containing protein [Legionella bononiensis]MBL7563722.1 DUF2231 domain-containing protein [Legionella bononiensis]
MLVPQTGIRNASTMIEIIPNWHPIFVHFTVALFTVSVILYALTYVSSYIHWNTKPLIVELEIVARWCLWLAALSTMTTVSAGFYAFYTVKHGAMAHAVKVIHRNWALATASVILLMAFWVVWRYIKHQKPTLLFLMALFLVQVLLLTTAWYGAELVYRHGYGVLPVTAEKTVSPH